METEGSGRFVSCLCGTFNLQLINEGFEALGIAYFGKKGNPT